MQNLIYCLHSKTKHGKNMRKGQQRAQRKVEIMILVDTRHFLPSWALSSLISKNHILRLVMKTNILLNSKRLFIRKFHFSDLIGR